LTRSSLCIYNMPIRFAWDETKREANCRRHGLDFVDAPLAFSGFTFTYEDSRFDYGEARFVTLGMVRDVVVSIAHTETRGVIRIISFRKATKHEQAIYFRQIQN
jgi:uncharacterized protein